MITGLRDLGCTVFLTTHYLDEAQHLADNIAVIATGRIIARGTAAELAAQTQARTSISWLADDGFNVDQLSAQLHPDPGDVRVEAGRVEVHVDDESVARAVHEITGSALAGRWSLADFGVTRPSLEETYFALVEAENQNAHETAVES